MKRIGQLLLIILGVFMLVGCGKLTTFRTITYDKYKEMVANKESFILFIGKQSCSACALYKEYLDGVITDYNVEVNYLDLEKMTDAQRNEFDATFTITSTPTTVFIVDGKEKSIYNRIIGSKDYDSIVDSFRKNGYIK